MQITYWYIQIPHQINFIQVPKCLVKSQWFLYCLAKHAAAATKATGNAQPTDSQGSNSQGALEKAVDLDALFLCATNDTRIGILNERYFYEECEPDGIYSV